MTNEAKTPTVPFPLGNKTEKEIEKGCGKLFLKQNVSKICGWHTGINSDKGVLLCLECKAKLEAFQLGKSQSQNHSQQNKTLQNSNSGNREPPVLVYANAVFSVKDKTADATPNETENEIEKILDRLSSEEFVANYYPVLKGLVESGFQLGKSQALAEQKKKFLEMIDELSFDWDMSRTQDEGTHCLMSVVFVDKLKQNLKEKI